MLLNKFLGFTFGMENNSILVFYTTRVWSMILTAIILVQATTRNRFQEEETHI